jgi:hypothetical protein
MHSTTRKVASDQCSLGTLKNAINHKMIHIAGILGPSVNHSFIAATQNSPNAINPNGIISAYLPLVA